MNKHFGIPYRGSKDKIATDILKRLPDGERFVDLFGGGFAMTHAAILSGKYRRFLYNDLDPLLPPLIKGAIRGDYSYRNFKPKFINREVFFREKDRDGYVKYLWSFGNNACTYLFGKNVEPYKKAAHNYVVFGKPNKLIEEIAPNYQRYVKSIGIHERRLEFCGYVKSLHKRFDLEQLERLERLQQLERLEQLQQLEQLQRLERLQQLERLEQLQQLERLEMTTCDYRDYQYQVGDVVYLDPPYEQTKQGRKGCDDYGLVFNSVEFYDWIASQPYPVYFSSYKISDKRFEMKWARALRTSMGTGNANVNYECLYYWKGTRA